MNVDAGLFLERNGLKLFELNPGDFNADGIVDCQDLYIWDINFGMPNAKFANGDGNGNCEVDAADYVVWRDHFGETGNANWSADFNRDGCVDNLDYAIWAGHYGLSQCASRFEGDADGDGDIDTADYVLWSDQNGDCGNVVPDESCISGLAMSSSGGEMSISSIKAQLPKSADMDGDGDVDNVDLPEVRQAVVNAFSAKSTSNDEAREAPVESTTPEGPTQVLPAPQASHEPVPTAHPEQPSGHEMAPQELAPFE
jgi:hypothetical protein